MDVGESRDIVIAILWARGEDRYDSVRLLKQSVPKVRDYYASGFENLASSAPSTPPTLYAPADGASDQPKSLRLSWGKQPDHQRYELFVSRDANFSEVADTSLLANPNVDLDLGADATYYWKVRGTNSVGKGPWSDTWSFSTGSVKQFGPGALEIDGSDQYAFIQIEGPEGENDTCNSLAESRLGCDEVGGNGVYLSANGAQTWLMGCHGEGPEVSIGRFAPRDYELRFSTNGSYAFQAGTDGGVFPVPFEAWDIGLTGPFGVNDTGDDIQLIPAITAGYEGDCRFGFGDNPSSIAVYINHHSWPATEAIDAHYPSEASTYADWEAVVEPLIATDPEHCPDASPAASLVDTSRRPLQNIVFLMDTTATSYRPEGIPTGNVIRFLTTRPSAPILSAPNDHAQFPVGGTLSRLALWWQVASTENELTEFPTVLTLHQPYPNPTSNLTYFDVGLPSAGHITLTAFDLLGRRVANIADTPMTAGWRTVDWNTTSVSNGVYVVRLQVGGASVSRKVVVVK